MAGRAWRLPFGRGLRPWSTSKPPLMDSREWVLPIQPFTTWAAVPIITTAFTTSPPAIISVLPAQPNSTPFPATTFARVGNAHRQQSYRRVACPAGCFVHQSAIGVYSDGSGRRPICRWIAELLADQCGKCAVKLERLTSPRRGLACRNRVGRSCWRTRDCRDGGARFRGQQFADGRLYRKRYFYGLAG